MRVALGLEYDGSAFSGWQIQTGARTVQEQVERALSRVADEPVRVHCAGRTDAGVHASFQVVHFDSAAQRSARSWTLGANVHLPPDASVLWARPVDPAFHARFGAERRRYRYVVLSRGTRPALLRHRVWWVHHALDAAPAAQAARYLVGEHDFSSFRAVACQARHPVRTVHALTVQRRGDYLYVDVTANGFLHHMVRNIAGVLVAIARGDRPPEWAQEVLEARDRSLGGVTAPPEGLYLSGVSYPERFGIPLPPPAPSFG